MSQPPNLRIVDCCNTCKHVQYEYEGERLCTKYPVKHDWQDEDDGPIPINVEQNNICDSHTPIEAKEPTDAP